MTLPVPPSIPTLEQFRTSTSGRFWKKRRTITVVDNAIDGWWTARIQGAKVGTPSRSLALESIACACDHWLHAKREKVAVAERDTGSTLAGRRWREISRIRRLASDWFAYEQSVRDARAYFDANKAASRSGGAASRAKLKGLTELTRIELQDYDYATARTVAPDSRIAHPLGVSQLLSTFSMDMVGLLSPEEQDTDEFREMQRIHLAMMMVHTGEEGFEVSVEEVRRLRDYVERYSSELVTRVQFLRKQQRLSRLVMFLADRTATTLAYQVVGTPLTVRHGRYVMDQYGNLLVDSSDDDPSMGFQHSSFNRGRGVVSAGDLKIADGQITYIDNSSGHYQPTRAQLCNCVWLLREAGVQMPPMRVKAVGSDEENAEEFLRQCERARIGDCWPGGELTRPI